MSDLCAFVPVVNRPDLLLDVLDAVRPIWDSLTVIDNSRERWVRGELRTNGKLPVGIYVPPVPLTFSQTMNWILEQPARHNKELCLYMHNDALIPQGACTELLEFTRKMAVENPRWGVIFTHYDVLCIYNPKVYQHIGGFDTNLPWYFSDNDYFRRMELAGWQKINSGIEVGHLASQTINSDPYLRHVNSITFPLYGQYYAAKWGGAPGREQFIHPFGVLPKEWKLANTPLTAK